MLANFGIGTLVRTLRRGRAGAAGCASAVALPLLRARQVRLREDLGPAPLGDSTDTLADHFGASYRIGKSDQADTDVWHYGPWPFSFEVKAGRVTSIRISDPAQ